jgi:glycosyltransferase 2 family protein
MPPENIQTSPARRYLMTAVKLAVSAALLAFLFSRIDVGRLWASARGASIEWLVLALIVYLSTVLCSVWRWWLLLEAQNVDVPPRQLVSSYLVALFFNNLLPSNIGGDVVRIGDTAKAARSKTLATTIILVDRIMGLMGLVLVAACGATLVASPAFTTSHTMTLWPSWFWGNLSAWFWAVFVAGTLAATPALFSPAGVGRLLRPLTVLHPEWVGGRIASITLTLARFKERPAALASCFGGAVFVQIATVGFYVAVAHALKVHIGASDLAVIVPVSGVVQMLPVSFGGLGIREGAFSVYFTGIGLPVESALLLSLSATALIMLFSLSGVPVYLGRGHRT